MRGSPLLRTLIVLAALLATIVGLMRLTSSPVQAVVAPVEAPKTVRAAQEIRKIPFELTLSAKAESVSVTGCIGLFGSKESAEPLTGVITVGDEIPGIYVKVHWADSSPGHRFAKLRLEIPGKPTLEHVFDAAGDIDDFWIVEE